MNCLHRGSAGGWHFDPDSVIMVERKMSLRSVTLESTSMGVDSSSRCLLIIAAWARLRVPPSEPHNKQCGAGPRGKAIIHDVENSTCVHPRRMMFGSINVDGTIQGVRSGYQYLTLCLTDAVEC